MSNFQKEIKNLFPEFVQKTCKHDWISKKMTLKKGDVLLEFSSVKWVLNEDHSFYSNLVGTLLSQNFVLDNSYFINFFVGQTTVEIEGIQKNWH